MKIAAKIGQFISWEERGNYFFNYKWGETPADLLHLEPAETYKGKWFRYFFPLNIGLVKLGLIKSEGEEPYENIIFGDGLPILVKRPHNFSLGDIIELDITIAPRRTIPSQTEGGKDAI